MTEHSLLGRWMLLASALVLSACGDDGPPPGEGWTTQLNMPMSSYGRQGLAWNGIHFVALGSGETIASTDALAWELISRFSTGYDVAWDGRSFVSVGEFGHIDTSPDGLMWRSIGFLASDDLHSVAGSGTTWVAVGRLGTILTSPDGLTWTTRDSPTRETLNGVVWTGSQFIAVGSTGTVVTSLDGTSWTLQPPPTSDTLISVAASSSLIVATTGDIYTGLAPILTSPDGITWTPRADLYSFNRIIFAGDRFVGVSDGFSATSSDGITWTRSGTIRGHLNGVVYAGEQYVAIGHNGYSTGEIFTSPDGLSWSTRAMAHKLVSVAQAPVDGRIVAVGRSNASQVSLDGITWEFSVLEQNPEFQDIVWSPSAGAFISLIRDGANLSGCSSIDGKTWTQCAYAPCQGALAASETMLVNVGGPCIATSANGAAWTSQPYPRGNGCARYSGAGISSWPLA